MSEYKSFLLRQLGVRESIKPVNIDPATIDPKELEMGIKDEKEHTNDETLAKKIALHHLAKHPDYYSKMKKAGIDETTPSPLEKMLSPTAISTPVLAIAVRGSNTGGLPSGKDMAPSKLGGYEPIPTAKENSLVVDKTPKSSTIQNPAPVAPEASTTPSDGHPHQVQQAAGEPPQAVTGASTDGDTSLKLKDAAPKGIDVDVTEERDDDKKDDEKNDEENDDKKKSGSTPAELEIGPLQEKTSTKHLQEIRRSLQEKAVRGKMNKVETELLYTIKEVIARRENKLQKPMFQLKEGDPSGRMTYQGKK